MAFDFALILLAVGIICGIILIAMAFLGGMDVGADVGDADADAGGGGPSPFGLPTVLSVLSVFGLVGYLVTVWFGDLNIGLVAGLITGVCLGAIIFMFLARLFRAQSSSDFRVTDLAGMIGEVTIPISRGEVGQVLVITEERGRNLVAATSDQECTTGSRVKILGTTGSSVIVEPLRKEVKAKER